MQALAGAGLRKAIWGISKCWREEATWAPWSLDEDIMSLRCQIMSHRVWCVCPVDFRLALNDFPILSPTPPSWIRLSTLHCILEVRDLSFDFIGFHT